MLIASCRQSATAAVNETWNTPAVSCADPAALLLSVFGPSASLLPFRPAARWMPAPCGAPSWRTGLFNSCNFDALRYLLPTVVLAPLLTAALLPFLWRGTGLALGWFLRRKTDGRRARIFEVTEEDEKKFEAEGGASKQQQPASDDEWENVDAYTAGSVGNGETARKDWDGIVGFFHPFWYVVARVCSPRAGSG